ncbi:MAG: hypothetical protein ABDH32_06110 [Candidatus Caldarchaeales archaeon]
MKRSRPFLLAASAILILLIFISITTSQIVALQEFPLPIGMVDDIVQVSDDGSHPMISSLAGGLNYRFLAFIKNPQKDELIGVLLQDQISKGEFIIVYPYVSWLVDWKLLNLNKKFNELILSEKIDIITEYSCPSIFSTEWTVNFISKMGKLAYCSIMISRDLEGLITSLWYYVGPIIIFVFLYVMFGRLMLWYLTLIPSLYLQKYASLMISTLILGVRPDTLLLIIASSFALFSIITIFLLYYELKKNLELRQTVNKLLQVFS